MKLDILGICCGSKVLVCLIYAYCSESDFPYSDVVVGKTIHANVQDSEDVVDGVSKSEKAPDKETTDEKTTYNSANNDFKRYWNSRRLSLIEEF